MPAANQASTTRRRPRSRRGDGGRLREEIIEAAREILAETGSLEGLTLRGVARRGAVVVVLAAGISLHYSGV